MDRVDILNQLKRRYGDLGPGRVTLVQMPIERSLDINVKSIKALLDLGYGGIYITLTKPVIELESTFAKNNIQTDRLKFIDGISKMYCLKQKEGVEYILGPLAVDAIGLAIFNLIPEINSEKKFVFLDSITAVLLYNSLPRTVQFSQFLIHSLKRMRIMGFFISVSRGLINCKLLNELKQMSDEVINIKELENR